MTEASTTTTTTTTQEGFHPLRGHVFDGATIRMRDGTVWTLKATLRGWSLQRADGSDVLPSTDNADDLTSAIVSY